MLIFFDYTISEIKFTIRMGAFAYPSVVGTERGCAVRMQKKEASGLYGEFIEPPDRNAHMFFAPTLHLIIGGSIKSYGLPQPSISKPVSDLEKHILQTRAIFPSASELLAASTSVTMEPEPLFCNAKIPTFYSSLSFLP